ncbi:MAG TPA: ribosomal protein S18-alanine N-acetyltransferase [Polyangiaceae bacterium]
MIACTNATPLDVPDIDRLARLAGLEVDAARSLTLPHARLSCARERIDGRFLGFLSAWHVADEIELLDLATEPSQRRRGVASALLQELTSTAVSLAASAVFLELRSSNHGALALYAKHGFRVVHERKNYYRDPVENAVCMRLDLDPRPPRGPAQ